MEFCNTDLLLKRKIILGLKAEVLLSWLRFEMLTCPVHTGNICILLLGERTGQGNDGRAGRITYPREGRFGRGAV